MIRLKNIKMPIKHTTDDLIATVKKLLKIKEIYDFEIIKKSIDARDKKDIHYIYTVDLNTHENYYLPKLAEVFEPLEFMIPKTNKKFDYMPIIVGSGPAGLFSALGFVEAGIPVHIIERGKQVEERDQDIKAFFQNRILNPNSNIQFGEGGAGTFSDGKLTTGVKDNRLRFILKKFVQFGAPIDILYNSKPHIGTDYLKKVVVAIREYLISKGCLISFETQLLNYKEEKDFIEIETNQGFMKTKHLILAIGHSARDTYEMLYDKGLQIEQKNFAVGVRIEHKQEQLQKIQYGEAYNLLPPTDYKLVAHINERTVYSFCVCPGGSVVAASSMEGAVVTNGMSEYARNLENINGALLVSVDNNDFSSDHPLAGMYYQKELEQQAFIAGGSNYNAPAQRLEDFLNNKKSISIGKVKPSYLPNISLTNLHDYFPKEIMESLKLAFEYFDKKIPGFLEKDAILTGIETRSSAPIRILRNQDYQASVSFIYPIGEGAGYAGGIMSSALDGLKCVLTILEDQ